MSGPWLSYVGAVEDAYPAIWAEELSIFDKLGLAPSGSDNRRVLAAITYLES